MIYASCNRTRSSLFFRNLGAFFSFVSVALFTLFFIHPALAASMISVNTFGLPNGPFNGSPIQASSPPMPIAKVVVRASSAGQTLQAITAALNGSGLVYTDLAAIANTSSSGVALYQDNGASVDMFDAGDSLVTLAGTPDWSSTSTRVITLTPATPINLVSGVDKVFFIVIRTSATIANNDTMTATISASTVITSDGNGPAADFTTNAYRVDTAPAGIAEVRGVGGSNTLNVFFSKPVQKVGGGNLVAGDSPFVYTDGGGSVQAISSISHMAGQQQAIITMSGNLDAADFAGSGTLAAGANKIADMAGNIVGTGAVGLTSPLMITTPTIPTATSGTTYGQGAPLITFGASGGAGSYTWFAGNASTTATLTTLGLNLGTNGVVTGTAAQLSGSFDVFIKVVDGVSASTTRVYTINVAGVVGGGIPGISNVSPPGGPKGAVNTNVTLTGANTHFGGSSAVQFLLPPGVNGTNGITVGSLSSSSLTSLTFPVSVDALAQGGMRNIRVTTGGEVVTLPNGFTVFDDVGAGLNLLLPTDEATGVTLPPAFSFSQSGNVSVTSYRITVKATSNPSDTAIWDYAFPKTVDGSGHCNATQCNLTYGSGMYRIITQPTPLAPNTNYYWQIRTYSVSPNAITDVVSPLESTALRKMTTTASLTDISPPNVMHRPVFQAKASTALNVYARVMDNLATVSSTPALTTTLRFCIGVGCTPTTEVTGTMIEAGYLRYIIPGGAIGTAGTIINYFIRASDGTNTVEFKQPNGSPFVITSAAGDTKSITGFVKDGLGTCSAGVQNALVFAEGTGYSAITDGSCAFTLSNIVSGTFDVVAAKAGYADRRIDSVPADSTGITLNLTQGGGGGFGGDVNKPMVKFTGPMNGMTNLPGADSNFRIFIVFNKTMSQNTISTSGNLTVNEMSGGALTDITSKGSWTYYASNPGLPNVPPEANMAVWSFTPGQTFGDDKTIAVIVSSNVTDASGNAVQGNQPNGSYSFSFTTGKAFIGVFVGGEQFGQGAFVPPHPTGSTPPPGMAGVPLNMKVTVSFSEPMASDAGGYILKNFVKMYTVSGATETDISSSAIDTVTLDTAQQTATVTLKGTYNSGLFLSNTKYRLKLLGGLKAASGMTLAPPDAVASVIFTTEFTTSNSSDTSAPSVVGSFPDTGATNVPVNMGAISIAFNKDLNGATISTDSVSLSIGSTQVNGTIQYRPMDRQVIFTPRAALSPNSTYTLTMSTAITGLNSIPLATAVTRSFTTGAGDTDAPRVTFMNADEYSAAITFSEPMISATAIDTLNTSSSVINPGVFNVVKYGSAGFNPAAAGTAVSLNTVTFSYDPMSNTVIIGKLGLPLAAIGQELYVEFKTDGDTVPKDLSGNALSTSATSVRARILNSQNTKGALEPMAMKADAFSMGGGFMPENFATGTFGFAPKTEVRPFNTMAGQSTIFGVRLPISRQLPSGGSVILTFPVGFNVSSTQQDVKSPMRTDLNGPGTGTPTFKCQVAGAPAGASCAGTANADDTGAAQGALAGDGVVVNTLARTVTIYINGATNAEGHDFLTIDISGILNSTVPKDFNTSGYTVDVKTMNGSTLLESMTSMPFFIQAAGTSDLTGTITATDNNQNGTMKVYLNSPMTGPLEATSANFSGGATAAYTFRNIPSGEYMLFTDQIVPIGASDYAGKSLPDRLFVTANATTTANFTLSSNSSGGTNVTINITGPANELLDIFAGSPIGFRVKQITLNGGGSGSAILNLADGDWFVGVGPQKPQGFANGPPPTPNYLPPKPKNVRVSGSTCTIEGVLGCASSFTLSATSKTIKGIVQDGAGKIMANAEIFAYSPNQGFGTHAQSNTAGAFTLNVAEGLFVVGAFIPGMPPSKEVPVMVSNATNTYLFIDGSATGITPDQAATTFILKVAKPDYTISGKVTDGTNVVQGASVYAYRTDGPGHANSITDSNGSYTLYVSNGAWKVGAFLPQYGNLTEQNITVSGSSASNVDFSPSLMGTFYTISGRVYKDMNGDSIYSGASEALSGAFVRVSGNSTANETISGSDGAYSFKVPAGNNYVVRAFAPGVGEIPPLAAFNVAANVADKDLVITAPRTVTYAFSSIITDGFIEASAQSGLGARVGVRNATSTTMQLPNGTYHVNIFMQGANLSSSSVSGTSMATAFDSTTGLLTVNGNEGLTVTIPTLRSVTGTVTDGVAAVGDAWVEIFLPDSNLQFGTKAASDGTFALQVADSTTNYKINAMKPGYVREPTAVTVSGANVGNQTLAMTAASLTISGRVFIGSSGASNAFIRAEKQGGNGFTGTQADANGNYTLYVTDGSWRIFAVGEGYAEAAFAQNPIVIGVSSVTDKNITVSTPVSLNPPKSKPITPSVGGTLEDTTLGVKLTIPASALGTQTSAGNLQVKETNNVRATSVAKPVSGKAKDIKATDSSGNPITSLSGEATVETTYSKTELAATASASDSSIDTRAEADKLKMAYWDETTANWVTLPSTITYLSATGSVVTAPESNLSNVATISVAANTTHFSLYAPVVATNPAAPSTPAGFTGSSPSAGVVNLSWSIVSGATSYNIYRDTASNGSFPRLGSEPTISSGSTLTYQNSNLNGETIYYYKITALNGSGESTSSSAIPVRTMGGSNNQNNTGGGGGGGLPAVTPSFQSISYGTSTSATSTQTQPVSSSATSTASSNQITVSISAETPALLTNLKSIKIDVKNLVKLLDDGNPKTQEDSAVYYIGEDGKRHAFPNAKVFFTWYTDFGSVKIISAKDLATIPLGINVTYRPGKRMVKFATDPKVYGVTPGGVLRWIKTEALAKALYGSAWNKMIDDMSDAFYTNYSFGKDVNETAEFQVTP